MITPDNNEFWNNKFNEIISLHEASLLCGLSQGHLALLIRQGKLKGWKIGRNWVTTKKSISEYLAFDNKPGPKKV